ncbi:unnamed protein product, partial [Hymenolepis diminuta]
MEEVSAPKYLKWHSLPKISGQQKTTTSTISTREISGRSRGNNETLQRSRFFNSTKRLFRREMGKGKGTNINGPPSEVINRTAVDRRLQRIRRNKSDPTEPMLSLFALNDLPEAERNTVLWNPCDPVSMEGRCWRSMFTSEPPLD